MIGIKGMRTIAIQHIIDPKNNPNVKQYFINDVDGDPTNIFIAQAAAVAGEKCLEQVLEYSASGIKNLIKISWRDATWSGSAWDVV